MTTPKRPKATFPATRLRRLRRSPSLRKLIRETQLSPSQLVLPLFVQEGLKSPQAVTSMPGVVRHSLDSLKTVARQAQALGIGAVLLFGLPKKKDAKGSGADARNGIIQKAIGVVKKAAPRLVVMTDVCLCEYTNHGHCGILKKHRVDNDLTLRRLNRVAVSHVRAGADLVAPSAMMDGQVRAIRAGLDQAGFPQLPIMAYAAKYASGFYGPFREAADSAPSFGNRSDYQMDPPNLEEALREVALDIEEGADIVMVKPAMSYLDVVRAAKERFHWPTAAYQVSGEYAMVKAAGARGWIDEKRVLKELVISMRRAGADLIVTYAALDLARWLKPKKD